jgi:hypothetical protein
MELLILVAVAVVHKAVGMLVVPLELAAPA